MDERMKQLLSAVLTAEQIEAANQYCLNSLKQAGIPVEENIAECTEWKASQWILCNFIWEETKEGKAYWQNIFEQLEKIESEGEKQ